MQFFNYFDGDNILFLTWIALIFLNVYNVKVKDIEITKRTLKDKVIAADMKNNIEKHEQLLNRNGGISKEWENEPRY